MSRQNKNTKKIVARKHFTALHKRNEKGPSSTKAVHGKVRTLRKISKFSKDRPPRDYVDSILDVLSTTTTKKK